MAAGDVRHLCRVGENNSPVTAHSPLHWQNTFFCLSSLSQQHLLCEVWTGETEREEASGDRGEVGEGTRVNRGVGQRRKEKYWKKSRRGWGSIKKHTVQPSLTPLSAGVLAKPFRFRSYLFTPACISARLDSFPYLSIQRYIAKASWMWRTGSHNHKTGRRKIRKLFYNNHSWQHKHKHKHKQMIANDILVYFAGKDFWSFLTTHHSVETTTNCKYFVEKMGKKRFHIVKNSQGNAANIDSRGQCLLEITKTVLPMCPSLFFFFLI